MVEVCLEGLMYCTMVILSITLVPLGIITIQSIFMVYATFKHVLLNSFRLSANKTTQNILKENCWIPGRRLILGIWERVKLVFVPQEPRLLEDTSGAMYPALSSVDAHQDWYCVRICSKLDFCPIVSPSINCAWLQLPCSYLAGISQLSRSYLAVISQLSHSFPTIILHLSHCYLAVISQLACSYLAVTGPLWSKRSVKRLKP